MNTSLVQRSFNHGAAAAAAIAIFASFFNISPNPFGLGFTLGASIGLGMMDYTIASGGRKTVITAVTVCSAALAGVGLDWVVRSVLA